MVVAGEKDKKKRKWMAKKELPLNCKGKILTASADRVGITFMKKHGKEKVVLDWLTIARMAFGEGAVFNTRERIREMGL